MSRRRSTTGTELAYKFTLFGPRSPFTRFEWPVGEWVELEATSSFAATGSTPVAGEALPRWLNDELWLVRSRFALPSAARPRPARSVA